MCRLYFKAWSEQVLHSMLIRVLVIFHPAYKALDHEALV